MKNQTNSVKFMVGDRVKFTCDIKPGEFDGEVIDVVSPTGIENAPCYLIQHLCEGGNTYHIPERNLVEYEGNPIMESVIFELLHM